ncbi:MAG: hypothetical protein M3140_03370 [Actinomycetota bacterium]|nr:hypothetical protein [Actinomycetota bacterium]
MPEAPEDFYARTSAAADADGRLPLPDMNGWTEVFPFDLDGLQVVALRQPAPEQPRHGAGGVDCSACTGASRHQVWSDDDWRLCLPNEASGALVLLLEPRAHHDLADLPDDLAGDLGRLTTHLVRAIEGLPHTARAHVSRWGDGGEHLHLWFYARPSGQLQLRGTYLASWDELLPPLPEDVRSADSRAVAQALVASYGGTAPTG